MYRRGETRVFECRNKRSGALVYSAPLYERPCEEPFCKTLVQIGHPYCARHLSSRLGLRIAQSQRLPPGCLGVFATRSFRKGDTICAYQCERVDEATLDLRYGDEGSIHIYTLEDAADAAGPSRRLYADASLDRCVGSMLNDSCGLRNEKRLENCVFCDGIPAPIRATRDIAVGEELYVSYGKNYWRSYDKCRYTYATVTTKKRKRGGV